jgi:molybdate transport system ATP-binding protein
LQTGPPEEVMNRPASAAVARLIDLRNVFAGRIAGHDREAGRTIVAWAGLRLEATARSDLAVGQAVSWAIPDGFVVLHRRDRPSRGEHENPVHGRIDSVLAIGQTAHLTLRPEADPAWPIHFSVPLHVARRNGIEKGVAAAVSLLAEAIHLMPPAPGRPEED